MVEERLVAGFVLRGGAKVNGRKCDAERGAFVLGGFQLQEIRLRGAGERCFKYGWERATLALSSIRQKGTRRSDSASRRLFHVVWWPTAVIHVIHEDMRHARPSSHVHSVAFRPTNTESSRTRRRQSIFQALISAWRGHQLRSRCRGLSKTSTPNCFFATA